MSINYENIAQLETFDEVQIPLFTIGLDRLPARGIVDMELRVNAVDENSTPVQFKTWLLELSAAHNGETPLAFSVSAIAVRNTSLAAGWLIPLVDNGDGTCTVYAKGAAATTIMWGIQGDVYTMDYLTFHPA